LIDKEAFNFENMSKMFKVGFVLAAVFFLSGCSIPSLGIGTSTTGNQSFLKSSNGGSTWEPKMKIDEKKNISVANILSMQVNPQDPNIIYIGTADNGLFVSKDGAETWSNIKFPASVYGLALNPQNPQIIYASGVLKGRAKIYKQEGEGQEWKEIYTEPSDGTIISALAIDRTNPQILYAGTNAGVIIRSADGGNQWINLKVSTTQQKTPVNGIAFDAGNSAHVYFSLFKNGLYETTDGINVNSVNDKIGNVKNGGVVYNVFSDPYFGGVVYLGMSNGILRGTNGGNNWESLNLIESSKKFPVRAIAINPKNSKEIIYAAGNALYKSTDNGAHWTTFQLNATKGVSVIKYDPIDPNKIYAGFRKFD
jgi:photosystem II stability/assembly factor-like uncharacterized protein